MPDLRDDIDSALGAVLFNAMNHPNPSAVLGRDVSGLRNKCVDAVWEVVRPDPVEVLAEQFKTAARTAIQTSVDLLSTSLGVPVLDVDAWLEEVDWRKIARDSLAPSD